LTRDATILTADPPPIFARLLATLLLCFLGAAAAAAFLLELPTTVRCPFVLVPEAGTDPVQTPWRGIVVKRLVQEGDSVAPGTTLYVIRSDDVRKLAVEHDGLRSRAPLLAERLSQARAQATAQGEASAAEDERLAGRTHFLEEELSRLEVLNEAARAAEEAGIARAAAEEKALEQLRVFRAAALETRSKIFARLEKLVAQGLKTEENLEQEELALEDARAALGETGRLLVSASQRRLELAAQLAKDDAERSIARLKLEGELADQRTVREREKHEAEMRRKQDEAALTELQATRDEEQVRIASLARELEGMSGDLVPVRSPRVAVIARLGPRDEGALVERGAMLCELARQADGARGVLRAELEIPARSAGEVKERQSVRLLYDAFPFSRFGARHATITWVSPTSSGQQGTFRAICSVDDQTIDSVHERRPLRPGMGGQASVVTGHKTLLALALEPLRELGENILPGSQ
jgi:multidrug efflux pump subunit AcrA (membrane-fusion protein)